MSCATGEFVLVVNGWRCAATAYDAPSPLVMVAVAEPVNGKPTNPRIAKPKADETARPWRCRGVKSASPDRLNRRSTTR